VILLLRFVSHPRVELGYGKGIGKIKRRTWRERYSKKKDEEYSKERERR